MDHSNGIDKKEKLMNNQLYIITEKLPKVAMMKSPAVSGPTPCQRSAAKEIDLRISSMLYFYKFVKTKRNTSQLEPVPSPGATDLNQQTNSLVSLNQKFPPGKFCINII